MPRFRLIPLFLFSFLSVSAHAAVPIPKPPALDVRSYVLIDFQTGRVLAADKAEEKMEPASITKLMPAYIAFEALREKRLSLTEEVLVSENAWRTGGAASGGSTTFLEVNSRVPVEVLIKGMIIQSGNDATIALAEKLGGTEAGFVQIMNQYAARLGMKNTHFENCWGAPAPNHYSTAADLATLSRALIRDFPEYYRYYSERDFTWNKHKQPNRNGLLARDPSVDGIKTGHTESAGYSLASSAKRGDMRLISIVLGTKGFRQREDASATLLNYGFTFFETVKAKGAGDVVLKPEVYRGEEEMVTLVPQHDVYVTIGRGSAAQLKTSATAKEPVIAPIKAGDALGELVVSDGKDVVARVPLVAKETVPEGGWWTRMVDGIALWMR
ncbi:MAG TPA: D-alanyl-D-alanine carboxypeptidase family protein [Steroidobacteraceae bacterium]|jgi:D-alanyl-D-alanine carboxypeptidase (penicillin-binding protein 5/6)|nr:D-alanyl-D-alanine carboxypeptidase family protein [Steroidobacteraceae bacterium]